jgi:hypothetical protein
MMFAGANIRISPLQRILYGMSLPASADARLEEAGAAWGNGRRNTPETSVWEDRSGMLSQISALLNCVG